MSYHRLIETVKVRIKELLCQELSPQQTLYTVIVRLSRERADLLAEVAISHLKDIKSKIKIITFDNGFEFADHENIASGLNAKIYFAQLYASWARGITENTNGLIRQYFPK